jgi:pimeloyl-ACP methyl ester carboxylesterase
VSELACQFGSDGRLSGVLTPAAAGAADTALVLVSAGLVTKYGPHRLYAELARRVAGLGLAAFRFDLDGIGYSPPDPRPLGLAARTAAEIETALDYLAAHHGIRRFVLGGLCSGAEDAFRYALRDPRVVALVMIDPFAYRTPGFGWRHLRNRLLRRALRLVGAYRPEAAAGTPTLIDYAYLARSESEPILAALLARAVRLHFVYTAGVLERFNHLAQFGKMFPAAAASALVAVDFFPRIEHTQMLAADRATLITAIAGRIAALRG